MHTYPLSHLSSPSQVLLMTYVYPMSEPQMNDYMTSTVLLFEQLQDTYYFKNLR